MRIRTTTIGTIEKYDAATQMATVKLACNQVTDTLDQNFLSLEPGTLIEVPVEFHRCGNFVITFPVQKGDDCVVTFFEQGISHWLYEDRRKYKVTNGRPEAAATRKFDSSDAICRIVVGNMAHTIGGFNTDGLEIRNMAGGQKITLHSNGDITLTTSANISMNAGGDVTISAGGAFKASGQIATVSGSSSAALNGGSLSLKGSSVSMSR